MNITSNAVFTKVKTAITTEYEGALCVSERLYAPPTFPCVWVIELDSYPTRNATTLDFSDEQVRSTFEIQVFSNLTTNGSGQAKEIINIAISAMRSLGYRCTLSSPVDNGMDASIKRHVARFTRFIGSGDTLPE